MGSASLGVRLHKMWSSLAFRVALLLTLSILPIGAIAIYQTFVLSRALDDSASRKLLASTIKVMATEEVAIERSIGTARALTGFLHDTWSDGLACSEVVEQALADRDGYRFLGVLAGGEVTCAASAGPDLLQVLPESPADEPFFARLEGDKASLIVGSPADSPGRYHVLLSTSVVMPELSGNDDTRLPEAFAIIERNGTLLRATHEREDFQAMLPVERTLADLAAAVGTVFGATTTSDEARVYSVVPVRDDQIVAVAVWDPTEIGGFEQTAALPPWLFPILMCIATLVISYVAINRLVVRHVQLLGKQMRRFARNKLIPRAEVVARQPVEFQEMNKNFRAMAEAIVQDEAELQNAIQEKTLLLREVHHRVKNNLQLIASIMNMQIRRSRDDETVSLLRRLQDRVLGLAAVHREMYRADALDGVPADQVLRAVLAQIIQHDVCGGAKVEYDLSPISLIPDQAVPLALLTAETATNAMSFIETNASGCLEMTVVLREADDGQVSFEVRNTVGSDVDGAEQAMAQRSDGLGSQLIAAFARQLNGAYHIEEVAGVFTFRLTFTKARPDEADSELAIGLSSQALHVDEGERGMLAGSAASAVR